MMASEALDTLASQSEHLQFVTHKWDLAPLGGLGSRMWTQVNTVSAVQGKSSTSFVVILAI